MAFVLVPPGPQVKIVEGDFDGGDTDLERGKRSAGKGSRALGSGGSVAEQVGGEAEEGVKDREGLEAGEELECLWRLISPTAPGWDGVSVVEGCVFGFLSGGPLVRDSDAATPWVGDGLKSSVGLE